MTTLSDGAYVVAWESNEQDGDAWGIYAQHYTADGTPIDGELQINTTTQNSQAQPSISALADGYVISWLTDPEHGGAPAFQVFNNDGTLNGVETTLSGSYNSASHIHVTGLPDGSFAVSWFAFDQDSNNAIFVQRFDADGGAPRASGFRRPGAWLHGRHQSHSIRRRLCCRRTGG
ncbi:MAG: hypothetical protein WDN06_15035, partial [Asticcacaulis sp.]